MTVCLWGRAVIWHVLIILLLPVECNIRVKDGQTNLIAWWYAGGGYPAFISALKKEWVKDMYRAEELY